jgi:hypothetical protein
MKRNVRVAGSLAAALIAVFAQPAAAERACLRFGEIYSWKALDNRTVIAEDNRHNKFRLALMGYCPDIQFKDRIGFQSPGSLDLSCMSPGDALLVRQFATGRPQRCPISSITFYTPEMERADQSAKSAEGTR